ILHLLCDISIHNFLAGLMLQLFLGCLTQTVDDHTIHITGAALIQILFGDFSITVVTANLQLIHTVRMLSEQSLELMYQNPSSRLPDILVHSWLTEPIIQQSRSQQRTFARTFSASGLFHSSSQV